MQDEQTLLENGFLHHHEWDWWHIGIKHFRKEINGKVFRAYVIDYNGPVYVSMGEVITSDGMVRRWHDCSSPGSVAMTIDMIAFDFNRKVG